MPKSYSGKFRFHIFNGYTRYTVATETESDLNGLIVELVEEIPSPERLNRGNKTWTTNDQLEAGLRHLLIANRSLEGILPGSDLPLGQNWTLEMLLVELKRQENEGLINNSLPSILI